GILAIEERTERAFAHRGLVEAEEKIPIMSEHDDKGRCAPQAVEFPKMNRALRGRGLDIGAHHLPLSRRTASSLSTTSAGYGLEATTHGSGNPPSRLAGCAITCAIFRNALGAKPDFLPRGMGVFRQIMRNDH